MDWCPLRRHHWGLRVGAGGGLRRRRQDPLRTYAAPKRGQCAPIKSLSVWKCWLPFLDTYRTMCLAPDSGFRRVLEHIRELAIAA
jgi:hypothetical protein